MFSKNSTDKFKFQYDNTLSINFDNIFSLTIVFKFQYDNTLRFIN